jgi:dethiobiotin synthetase
MKEDVQASLGAFNRTLLATYLLLHQNIRLLGLVHIAADFAMRSSLVHNSHIKTVASLPVDKYRSQSACIRVHRTSHEQEQLPTKL